MILLSCQELKIKDGPLLTGPSRWIGKSEQR